MTSTIRGVDLNIENLWKGFGKTQVLQGLNLEIKAGEFIAIVGRSGCGKSTLLRAIAGLAAPNSGSLWVDDQPVKGINPIARVMFQEPRLLPWKKVYQNVSDWADWFLGGAVHIKDVVKAVELCYEQKLNKKIINIEKYVAQQLAKGKIIAWCQGRLELVS